MSKETKKQKDNSPDASRRPNFVQKHSSTPVDAVVENKGTATRLAAKQQESNGPVRKKVKK